MLISMVMQRPLRRVSYSAILFDIGKCRHTTYHMCLPRGETKSRLALRPFLSPTHGSIGSNTQPGSAAGATKCQSIQ
jgi:hypothetical protein